MRKVSDEGLDFAHAERMILGIDHAIAGGYIAEEWCLPDFVGDAIKYHHDPDMLGRPNIVVDLVHIADNIGTFAAIDENNDNNCCIFSQVVLERNGIDKGIAEETCLAMFEELNHMSELVH